MFWPQFFLLDIVFRDMGPKLVFDRNLGPLYASIYFAVSTPIFLLVLAPVGAGWAIYRRSAPIIAATLVFVSVLVAQAVTSARVYSGCRHILFLYPFFMLVAAYPVALLLDGTKSMLARVAVVGTLGLCIAATAVEMYRLFPYQYSFYNALVGGIEAADGFYEIDPWRSAHPEAIEQIVPRVEPGETVRIFSCASKLYVRIHPGFELAKSQDAADYVIELRRKTGKCAKAVFDGLPLIREVERKGVVLAKIYAVR